MDLRVMLKLDGSGFTQGISKVRQQVGHLSSNVFSGLKGQIAAAFTVGAVSAFSKKIIEFGSHMRDLSDRLGVNVEWLQKMNNAAGMAGASADDLANFMNKIAQAREAAVNKPEGDESKRFQRMGFSQSDMANLPAQKFVEKLTQAFAGGMTGQMEVDLLEVGGRSAKNLLAAFSSGMDSGIPVMSEETINALDNIGDSFFTLKQELITGFAPAVVKVAGILRQAAGMVGDVATVWKGIYAGKSLNEIQKDVSTRWINRAATDLDLESFRAQEDKRRKERETRGPGFIAETKAEKEATVKTPALEKKQIVTDSLLAVGNFLGAGRSTINSIAMETNKLLRGHTKLLERIAENGSQSSLDIQVPGF